VKVWDAATGGELLTLKGHTNPVVSLAFSPDGRRLASASWDKTVRVWDAATGGELLTLKGHTRALLGVAFSPDGTRLASAGGDGTVKVWDAATGGELLTLKGHTGEVSSVAFSPDGRRLASAGRDGTVKVWDAGSGQETLSLKAHTAGVSSVAFSPDGLRLASASVDGTAKVWDAATGGELLILRGHPGGILGVAFSPDGTRLAGGDQGGAVKVWDASPVPAAVWRQREMVSHVDALFEELGLRDEVFSRLRKEPALTDSDRDFAFHVAQTHQEYPWQLYAAAWERVKTADLAREAYALALRQAEAAVRLDPGDGNILNTLGVAQYRMGQYAEAVATLTQSDKINAEKGGSLPADLAFLAMAQHRLGRKEQTQATLGRLREALKQPRWANDAESQGFLREAEALLQGKR
jgi:dipeptidyl aminopeptidase/acylaminoacyl peptidase